MRKSFAKIGLGALFIVLCLGLVVALPLVSQANLSNDASLRILFTHDMHSKLLPYKTRTSSGERVSLGGYKQLSEAIEKRSNEDAPATVVLDAGDYSMGTLFNAIFESDGPDLALLALSGYDAVTLGNHEFDYGAETLAKSINASLHLMQVYGIKAPQILSANLDPSVSEDAATLEAVYHTYPITQSTVIERGGYKIGVFGIIGDEAWSYVGLKDGIEHKDPILAAKEASLGLKAKGAEIIIALSHTGNSAPSKDKEKSEDFVLAKEVPEIDVIISGHSHTLLEEPEYVGDTIIVSAGSDMAHLGVLDLDLRGDKPRLVNYSLDTLEAKDDSAKKRESSSKTFAANGGSAMSKDELLDLLLDYYTDAVNDDFLKEYDLKFDQVLSSTSKDLVTLDEIEARFAAHGLGTLIADSFIHEVTKEVEPVSIAVSNAGSIRASLLEGEVTTSDLYNIASLGKGPDNTLGFPLVKFYITGSELRDLCEVDVSVSPMQSVAQLFFSGLRYEYNPSRVIFDRVHKVETQNASGQWEPIKKDELYPVICSLYMGQMAGLATDATFGLISIEPKDASGNVLEDINTAVLHDRQGHELKEWLALTRYVESFNGEIPVKYASDFDYKIETSSSPLTLIKSPGKVSWYLLGIICALLALIILLVSLYIRRHNKRKELI